eukprot:UN12976
MNNEQYISALKRALSGLEKNSRDEILREIRSHLQETAETETLEKRFGPVEELASQYLDGESISPSMNQRISKAGKTVLLVTGGFFTLCVLVIVSMAIIYSQDTFNYSDKSELAQTFPSGDWSTKDWHQSVELKVKP